MSDVPPPVVTYEFLGFRLDPRRRALSRADGAPVEITAKIFDALVYLVVRAGTTVSREELMAALWPRTIVEDNNLNKVVAALRRALGDRGATPIVATVPGRGYQFVAEVRAIQAPTAHADATAPDIAAAPIAPLPADPVVVEDASHTARAPRRLRPRAWLVAGALLALVSVALGQLVPTLSKDGSVLAMPLIDGDMTNIWMVSTSGGPMRPVTDFGDRSVLIARRVAWSPDGRYVYASVADVDSDIMLIDGLLR